MKIIETDTVILGAGLTGLVLSDLLSKKNKEIILLEKESSVGGLAKTIDFNGFKFDLGGHRLYFINDKSAKYINDIVKNRLLHKKRRSSIYLNSKFLKYPPGLFDLISYNILNIFKFSFDSLNIRTRKIESLEDWIISRMGKTVHDVYFRDYTKKVWGLGTNLISPDWAEKRIGRIDKLNMIKNIFIKRTNIQENLPDFYYPENGIGMICESLKKRLSPKVGILLGAELVKIEYNGEKLNSLVYRDKSGETSVSFKRLISSIPLLSLYGAIFNPGSALKERLRKSIRYRNLILALIILKQDSAFKEHWVYFPQQDIPFSRISEPKNWCPLMVKGDKTSLCVEIFCDEEDEMWSAKPEFIIDIISVALKKMNILKDKIEDYSILRIPYAYPVLYLGYKDNLQDILNQFNKFKNLSLAGRSGTHSYYDMYECLIEAEKLSKKLSLNI